MAKRKPPKVNMYDAELYLERCIEQAMKSDYIKKPISWALYQTWKWADATEEERGVRGNMNKNEAINFLQSRIDLIDKYYPDVKNYREALVIAIEALEQESILDKIKAEIDQKQYDFMDDKDYDEGIRFGLMLAYQILDKYRAESEEEE